MRDDSPSKTSASLLGRLRLHPSDQAAWNDFVSRYGPKIYAWCRRWDLQDADASDVTQNVLVKLAVRMHTFTYDPTLSFRVWLLTLTRHALSDFLAQRGRARLETGGTTVEVVLANEYAREDMIAAIARQFDEELLARAFERVRRRVEPQTWEAFRLTAIEHQSGATAAGQLGMRVGAVFRARSIVQKMLREEVRELEGAGDGGAGAWLREGPT
jgi:RNA polymerase sigma factor (sigma-70 family)